MMKKTAAIILAIIALVGVLATTISAGLDHLESFFGSALSTLKYFTIQSNLIISAYFFAFFVRANKPADGFDRWLGGVTVYITITGLVFVTLLQSIWHPTGLGLLGNILNHYLVPILSLGFLISFRKDYRFSYKDILWWMIYPLGYAAFMWIHGRLTGDYIYPFFDIASIGIGGFLIAFFGILALFFILSLCAVSLTKKKPLKNQKSA